MKFLGLLRVKLAMNECETSIKVGLKSPILNPSLNPYKRMLV